MKRTFLISSIILFSLSTNAQIGGRNSFAFLQSDFSAKSAALGGYNVTSGGSDATMLLSNPALLNEKMYKKVNTTYVGYGTGAKFSALSYTFSESKIGAFSAGLNYINYGEMDRRDETGEKNGNFFANDMVIYGTKSFTSDNFRFGVTPKIAFSQIENYTAFAIATDLGALFVHPDKDLTIGLAFQNVGTAIKTFNKNRAPLPFDVVAGISIKPEHMPLRMSITAHHLHKFNISYDDPASAQSFFVSDSVVYKTPLSDIIFRHFNFGGEFILSDGFNFRFGYNYLNRKELRLSERSGGSGFSFGFMIRAKAVEVNFTKTFMNYAARPTYLTLNIDIDRMLKKRDKKVTQDAG